jgi:hypothetical protein
VRRRSGGLGPGEHLLALGDGGDLLGQLRSGLRPLLVGSLQLAHLQLDELLPLLDAGLRLRELALEVPDPRLGVGDFLEPIQDMRLALLELGLGRGQRRRPPLELTRIVAGLDFAAEGVDLLAEGSAELLLPCERRRQLGA